MNGGDAIGIVVQAVEGAGLDLPREKRPAIGKYAKGVIEKHGEETARAWAEHYGARLGQGAHIKPSQALEDVLDGINAGAGEAAGDRKEKQRARRMEGYEWFFEDREPAPPTTRETAPEGEHERKVERLVEAYIEIRETQGVDPAREYFRWSLGTMFKAAWIADEWVEEIAREARDRIEERQAA